MDNFTHSLAGWIVGQAGLKTKSRKGLAALILGANAPDIDVFFGHSCWEPLATHRGVTHSLVGGVIVLPLLLTGLLLLLDRWQVRRGTTFKSGLAMRPGWLLALAFIGTLTHPLLDLQTTYSVQLFSPFSGAWWHSDTLFIIDAVLWTLLPLSIAISRRREKRGGEWRRPAQVGIAAALAYLGLNLALTQAAVASVRGAHAVSRPGAIFASPPPVLFWKRTMTWPEAAGYRQAAYDPLHGLGPASAPLPDGLKDPAVAIAVRGDRRLRDFLNWSVMPVARVTTQRCSLTVTLADARYFELGARARLSRSVTLPRPCRQSRP